MFPSARCRTHEEAASRVCGRPLARETQRFKAGGRLTLEQDTADPTFTFAFQPIVDVNAREVISYEALIRGPGNESAYQILKQVPAERLLIFDWQSAQGQLGGPYRRACARYSLI